MNAARPRGLHVAALGLGTLGLGTGIAAAVPTDGEAQAPTATATVGKNDERVGYRERVAVRGTVASRAAGRPVTLQYAPRGGAWRDVATTSTRTGGRYAVAVRPRTSGAVRAVVDGGQSASQRIAVAPRLRVSTRRHIRRGGIAIVRGSVAPGTAGRTVLVQISRGRGWDTVDRARTRAGGRFRATWRQSAAGRYAVRAVFRGDRANAAGRARSRTPLNVYRPAHASWYGPGFYGNRTACGRTLGTGTLGVAHKSLPCGTRVTFRHRGRSVTVPVIDRGPYVGGREWDLTGATKRALGFGSTGTVWAAH